MRVALWCRGEEEKREAIAPPLCWFGLKGHTSPLRALGTWRKHEGREAWHEGIGLVVFFFFLTSCLLNIFPRIFCRDFEMSSSDRKSDKYPPPLYRQGGLLQGCICKDQF